MQRWPQGQHAVLPLPLGLATSSWDLRKIDQGCPGGGSRNRMCVWSKRDQTRFWGEWSSRTPEHSWINWDVLGLLHCYWATRQSGSWPCESNLVHQWDMFINVYISTGLCLDPHRCSRILGSSAHGLRLLSWFEGVQIRSLLFHPGACHAPGPAGPGLWLAGAVSANASGGGLRVGWEPRRNHHGDISHVIHYTLIIYDILCW